MKSLVPVLILGLFGVGHARQDYSPQIIGANQRINRRYVKNLRGVDLNVCFIGSQERGQRLKEAVELHLRQSHIPFYIGNVFMPDKRNYPPLTLTFDKGVCEAYVNEGWKLPRNGQWIYAPSWKAHWGIYDKKSVNSEEEAVKALDEAAAQFCNDWMAANPKGAKGIP